MIMLDIKRLANVSHLDAARAALHSVFEYTQAEKASGETITDADVRRYLNETLMCVGYALGRLTDLERQQESDD